MSLIQPFDLEKIFIQDLAGNPEIFSFFAILLVAFAFSKFNLPGKIALPLFALFAVIMSNYMGGIYVLAILLAGVATFYALSKMAK